MAVSCIVAVRCHASWVSRVADDRALLAPDARRGSGAYTVGRQSFISARREEAGCREAYVDAG